MTTKTIPGTFTVSAATLPRDLYFHASPRDPVEPAFIIHADGRVTVPDNKTVDDAARAFWTTVRRINPFLPKLDREQCVRAVVAKLMSHHGFELTNPNADVLELENPRARAWVSLSHEIVDALFADKQG
ncbi:MULTISPECIES: hypothetical protein [Burkholderia]|uniref:hypothetical protein n=1 Tax=Burkholderia TaxID=32008 RepID=UPI00064E830C|nr:MULTISPECIES: hypothetical protein [Burkholderia]KML20247.1 hypothetical protein VL00_04670 [Burkholderia cepacia]KML38260.1 hypothetical protein VL13_21775 [Burkholderia lata]KMN61912.1 hypothetical protein VK92_04855 [Burkholderia sp. LK4]